MGLHLNRKTGSYSKELYSIAVTVVKYQVFPKYLKVENLAKVSKIQRSIC